MAANDLVEGAIREVRDHGYCVLHHHQAAAVVHSCREGLWPHLLVHLASGQPPNRGPGRYFLAMPFELPCFAPELLFDPAVLDVVRSLMDDSIVADQWGCDVPVRGSLFQDVHIDYQRPLFPECPDLTLPPFAIVVSFAVAPVTGENGPIEIAPGTHPMTRVNATRAVESGDIPLQAVTLDSGDVLIRHPLALHRGTPNTTRYAARAHVDPLRPALVQRQQSRGRAHSSDRLERTHGRSAAASEVSDSSLSVSMSAIRRPSLISLAAQTTRPSGSMMADEPCETRAPA